MLFYSKSENAFYDREIHGINIPLDAVEISSETHQSLLSLQASGKRIVGDVNGNPVAVNYEPLPVTEDDMRAERDRLLKESDWTMMPDAPLSEEVRAAWVVYRQALRDVTKQPGFPADTVFPERPKSG